MVDTAARARTADKAARKPAPVVVLIDYRRRPARRGNRGCPFPARGAEQTA